MPWSVSSTCTDDDGKPIPSIFQHITFEKSAFELWSKWNTTKATTESALEDLLQLKDQKDVVLTFDNTIGEFERLQDDYIIMEKHVNLLEQASDIAEVREASQQIGMDIETWERTNILFNNDLYDLLVAYNQTGDAASLSGQPRRLLDITLGDFEERGVGLSKHDRRLLQDWMGRLSELESTISANIIDDMGEVDFTAGELKGLTDDQLAEFEYDTETGKYKVLTATPSQDTDVMLYAIDPKTRLKTVTTWLSRNKDRNGPLILETVQLRYVSSHIRDS